MADEKPGYAQLQRPTMLGAELECLALLGYSMKMRRLAFDLMLQDTNVLCVMELNILKGRHTLTDRNMLRDVA